ncbi:MAG: trypsin-like peptidase domain-containing protein [Chloroflexi bacterium]|nr:trypsin-like peptidase domain-containing protein [Chloroflexota bacterium]
MTLRAWLVAFLFGAVIVVSMGIGAMIATSIGGDDAGPVASAPVPVAPVATGTPTAAASPTATTQPPVVLEATPTPTLGSASATTAIQGLPDMVERVVSSVVQIRARGQLGGGVGSGVVVDQSGHIVTNDHVVRGALTIVVELHDGTVVAAEVLGSDPSNDLAVLRANIPAGAALPAAFGDSDLVRVGEPVFAIGNPFDLDFTVTSGIVSGIDREAHQHLGGRPVRGVIQTDAAVNPGNSGGPLFNSVGEVIGITTAVENPAGQSFFIGIGYAVPSNTVLRYIPEMIAGAEITHAQLGIAGVTLNAINAADAGVEALRGVYITAVVPGSAADRAGIVAASQPDGQGDLEQGGDVITAFAGTEITSMNQLSRLIDDQDVGTDVMLTVVRDGQAIELTATLRMWPG